MGRHVKFLDEFGLNPHGIDLSDKAIALGKYWFESIGNKALADKLIVGSVAELPYPNDYFDICISQGVLDSMPREIAKKGLEEACRCLKKDGLMYFSVIMDSEKGNKDEIVEFGYEKDTTQSYYTIESIREFVGDLAKIVDFKVIVWNDENGKEMNRRAYCIIKK